MSEQGPLYERLHNTPGPKRILALDGGGIRGALTLGFLEKMEAILRERHNNPKLLLCDYFDLIVGTSTGGIIATGLATGMTAGEIKELYLNLGEKIFGKKNKAWVPGFFRYFLTANYDHRPLEDSLLETFGDLAIGNQERIKTGLCITAKRADTFSTWTLVNFPKYKYYKFSKHLLVRDALRATSAAPSYFAPKVINVGGSRPRAAFVDGGVSLANNPSFQALMLARIKGFGLNWNMGLDQLMIVSVGTGTSTKELSVEEVVNKKTAMWGAVIPDLFMEDASYFNQALLQWMSESPTAQKIDRVIGTLEGEYINGTTGGPLLTYNRYNIKLDAGELLEKTGKDYSPEKLNSLRQMDIAANRFELAEIGAQAASDVQKEHFPKAFDLG